MTLDETDRALLSAMLEDARISQRALARKVGIAQGTVLNRVRRMEHDHHGRSAYCQGADD
jgi:DNA-binding Lrp family transcriptional regulator